MSGILRVVSVIVFLLFSINVFAEGGLYGARLCHKDDKYDCYKVKKGESWKTLFPDEDQREIVKKVNRIGISIHRGQTIAVPKNLSTANVLEFSPLPQQISAPGEKIIMVTLHDMAWGAYAADGKLLRWGPASSARGYCPDVHRACHTVTGHFAVYHKEGPGCFSRKFPVGRGGAPMPWCMFFHGGFALHGSYEVPGYNASHGCIRLFVNDAEWLNQEFVDMGTPVIVHQ